MSTIAIFGNEVATHSDTRCRKNGARLHPLQESMLDIIVPLEKEKEHA